MQREGVVQNAT